VQGDGAVALAGGFDGAQVFAVAAVEQAQGIAGFEPHDVADIVRLLAAQGDGGAGGERRLDIEARDAGEICHRQLLARDRCRGNGDWSRTLLLPILCSMSSKGADMAEFDAAEFDRAQLPEVMSRNEDIVRAGFWAKLKRVLSRVPFAEDAVAAWFCASDPQTPLKVRGMLLAALAYFVLPFDAVPDMILGSRLHRRPDGADDGHCAGRRPHAPGAPAPGQQTLERMRQEG
jgi:hypothetical protein